MKHYFLLATIILTTELAWSAHRESVTTSYGDKSCGKAGIEVTKRCARIEKSFFSLEKQKQIFNREVDFVSEESLPYHQPNGGIENLCHVVAICHFDLSDL